MPDAFDPIVSYPVYLVDLNMVDHAGRVAVLATMTEGHAQGGWVPPVGATVKILDEDGHRWSATVVVVEPPSEYGSWLDVQLHQREPAVRVEWLDSRHA